jgi:hypothetical protein
LVDPARLQPVPLPSWSIGATVTAAIASRASASLNFAAENLRPLSPIDATAERLSNGDLALSWTRRSRRGFAWVDGVDAPLGETREQYRIVVSGSGDAVELRSTETQVTIPGATLSLLGSGAAMVEVQQIGDFAASVPTQLIVDLS